MPRSQSKRSSTIASGKAPGVPSGTIRIGPAGWSYPDWAGYVYPSPRPKGFHEATYLAQFFDTIEINTSFYAPLRADHARQWIDRVAANPRFLFTAKLWQRFTHDTLSIPSSSNLSGSSLLASERSAIAAPAAIARDESAVRAGFDVLMEAGKLVTVLSPPDFLRSNDPLAAAYVRAFGSGLDSAAHRGAR